MEMRNLVIALIFTSSQLFAQSLEMQPDWKSIFTYRNVGPSRGGRVTSVAGVVKSPSTFFMGATGGGLWKTTDYGKNWANISDGYFATGSIGSIAVFQGNPSVIYVGTGSDGIRSNVIIGKGLYKSIDGGKSWQDIGLNNVGQIGSVVIHPDNPDIVWVAAIGNPFGKNEERGVFKTIDGGKSWNKVLFLSSSTGVCDLELVPGNPNIVYASAWSVERKPWTIFSGSEADGIYKSENGGSTWTKLSGGLPKGLVGKSDLAVTPSKPEMLYVLIEAPEDKGGLYISMDYGNSFEWRGDQPFLIERPFYYTNIDVDPTNPDVLWVNCTGFYKSSDRGRSWSRQQTPHGDNHDMWINPENTDIIIQANDGGANVSTDGGKSWSTQENQLTAELYQVDVDDQFPYWLYAGQQDNSTIAVPSSVTYPMPGGNTAYWLEVGGCETGPAVPKPGNHNIVYANCKGHFGRYNKLTGQEKRYSVGASNIYGHDPADLVYRFQRVAPIVVSSHNNNVVYHASQYLHRTMDEGVTWETISPDLTAFTPETQGISGSPITRDITGEEYYSTIYAVAESPVTADVLWTGANDGPLFVTRDGGKNWENVTPKGSPEGGRVQTVEASHHNSAKAYFAMYRYLLDDWKPYIYMTKDYGHSWSLLTDGTNGIPLDEPVRVVREDPVREGLLFAGTEKGVYVSFDDGKQWNTFSQNFPVVPVTDIKIVQGDLALSTMGRSFWIMDNIQSLRSIELLSLNNSSKLFEPLVGVRTRGGAEIEIDYYLAGGVESLELIIDDSEGAEVWRVATTGNSRAMRGGLSANKGMNRYTWDLRSFGPAGVSMRRSGGPVLPPGKYSVKLVVGSEIHTAKLEIVPDPVVTDDGVTIKDMEDQYKLACDVRKLVVKAKDLEKSVGDAIEKLEATVEPGKKMRKSDESMMTKLKALSGLITTEKGIYPQAMLSDQVSYLYSLVNGPDQRPGKDSVERFHFLEDKVAEYEASLALILKK